MVGVSRQNTLSRGGAREPEGAPEISNKEDFHLKVSKLCQTFLPGSTWCGTLSHKLKFTTDKSLVLK